MSTFTLTRGSEAALGMLASQAGSETLLLTQPARELRAELSIEPFTSDSGDQLLAVLFMCEQRHSMTLQRNDGANAQHLADWIEAVANGTLDTAEAIPQRTEAAPLLPCTKCNGQAIAYDYADPRQTEPGPTRFVNGVKCRHGDCQKTEMHETEATAASAWNAIQLEQLADSSDLDAQAEPAPAQDELAAFGAWYVTPEAFKAGDSNGWRGVAWAAWQTRASLCAELVDALEAMVRQYPNPDLSHVDYRVHACKQAEHALGNYRAALASAPAA